MKLKCNCCDGIYHSFDVHFTSSCDNKCAHCIDMKFGGIGKSKPDIDAIYNSIYNNMDGMDDVLFLGGEPCLYLQELVDIVKRLKENTNLKLFVTTSVPKICFDKYDLFVELLSLLDGINLSVQSHDEEIADKIRCIKSKYNRQKFYSELPYKEKIRINLNIVKPYLYTKEQITDCLCHYDKMGFNSIKLSEIQHGKEYFVSFEDVFNVKFGSPFSSGCQKYIDMSKILQIPFKTPVLLKRSCFVCEETLKASFCDGIKSISKLIKAPFARPNKYGVVYEDGRITKNWI